ncbi:MAG TPA: hypothetical protein VG892_12005 [Terriglobales bacterium]|nr:hypothetical protein [Terriglobales bacterium]
MFGFYANLDPTDDSPGHGQRPSNRHNYRTEAGAKVGLAQKAVSKIELAPERAGLNMIFKVLAALDLELVVRPRAKPAHPSEW